MTVRELNGWSPATVTFSRDGEILTTTIQEPRFTPAEKATLLAARRASFVPRGDHGLALSETTDPENQFAYTVPPPRMDWAQKKLNETQEAYRKSNPSADMSSLLWRVEKT